MTHTTSRYSAIAQLSLVTAMLLMLALVSMAQTVSPDADPLTKLMKGNERFVSGKLQTKDYRAERPGLMQGQKPYAIVLACADSHVPPELVFDESVGRLYVVRTAGHVLDSTALGSIEYAVEHLGTKLLFVLGHEGCNAVKAAISGGAELPNVKALLNRLQAPVDKSRAASLSEPQLLKRAIQENVRYQMQKAMFGSDLVAELVHDNKLKISGGVYNLLTGAVAPLNTDLAVHRTGGQSNQGAQNAHAANDHSPAAHAADTHGSAAHAPDAHAPAAHAPAAAHGKAAAHAPAAAHGKPAAHAPAAAHGKAAAHAPAAHATDAHAPAAHATDAHAPAAHAPANDHGHDAHATPAQHTSAKPAQSPNAKKAVHKPAAHDTHAAPAHKAESKAATNGHDTHHSDAEHKAAPSAHKEAADSHGKPHSSPAPASKATHSDAHSSLQTAPHATLDSLEKNLQLAYAGKKEIVVKKPALMRDSQDRCATQDCRRIEAGEKIKLESPTIVKVMGRPQIKVRYKGKPYFILADSDTLALASK